MIIMRKLFTGLLMSLLMMMVCTMTAAAVETAVPADGVVNATSAEPAAAHSAEMVMQQFDVEEGDSPQRRIETERKHQILFLMGISLLVLLLITGTLGIAMVAFDKDVFLPHMISAGLSLTLAAVHSATAIAWFWPW